MRLCIARSGLSFKPRKILSDIKKTVKKLLWQSQAGLFMLVVKKAISHACFVGSK